MEMQCGSLHSTRTCLNLLICQSGIDWKKPKAVTVELGKVVSFKEFSWPLRFSSRKEHVCSQDGTQRGLPNHLSKVLKATLIEATMVAQ